MNRFKANQKLLFKAETVFNLRPLEKYEILFSFLDTSPLEILYPSTGRPPIPYEALLKALLQKFPYYLYFVKIFIYTFSHFQIASGYFFRLNIAFLFQIIQFMSGNIYFFRTSEVCIYFTCKNINLFLCSLTHKK